MISVADLASLACGSVGVAGLACSSVADYQKFIQHLQVADVS